MATIKGQNLRVLIGAKCVAFATSCTLHVSATLEDSSTKDDTGNWQQQTVTGKAWDVSVDALYSVDTDATGVNGSAALDTVLAGQEVSITFDVSDGDKNRTATNTAAYGGKAIVNDISITAANRQNATYTMQAQGNGQLMRTMTATVSGAKQSSLTEEEE